MDNKRQSALVTGASSGIGEATALLLQKNGFVVYAAARRTDRMRGLQDKGIHVLSLDVTDEASSRACVDSIIEREGVVDILINNAGYGSYGAIEEVPIEEARRQFEVNLFGLARITQLVLPGMREKGSGRIVNISSIGGKIYAPFGGWYHATKHALEGWSDCLRLEARPFGIGVSIIEPGGIDTPWSDIAVEHLRKTSGSGPYATAAGKTADAMEKMYASGRLSDPSVVAEAILASVTARRPRTRYRAGYMSGFSLFLRWILPDRVFDRAVTSVV